jgi:hypothetical protein
MLADRFGIIPLQEACYEVVSNYIDLQNCCALLEMTSIFNWTSLRAHCIRFLECHFLAVAHECEEFYGIPPQVMLELILSDDLMISDETEVYRAFMAWQSKQALYSPLTGEQLELFEDLICCLRFPLMSETFLETEVIEHNPVYKSSNKFQEIIRQSLEYIRSESLEPSEQQKSFGSLDSFTMRPRTAHDYAQLLFSHIGDQNGVCYYIGCNFGTSTIWQNPHKSKRLSVFLSSPESRYCRADLLVNRNYATTNYITGDPPWAMIDFGESHQLICNHYSMCLDGSGAYLTHWALQACNSLTDGWVNLSVHRFDEGLSQRGQHADWAVFGKSARAPYRYFRIIVTPPAKALCISAIELYGYYK